MSRYTTARLYTACFVILSLGFQFPPVPFLDTASAADLTWTGANSGNISDTGNWSPAQSISGNTAIFQGNITNANITQDLAAGTTLTGITFANDGNVTDGNVSEFTLSGNSITLDGNITTGGVVAAAANTTFSLIDTINLDIALANDTIITVGGDDATPANTTRGLTLNGIISGAHEVRKEGGYILTLSGINTYSGGTDVRGGTLIATSGSALGTGLVELNDSSNVEPVVVLDSTSGNLTFANDFRFSNTGGTKQIHIDGGNQVTISGNIALDDANDNQNSIGVSPGSTLLLTGTITGGQLIYNNDYAPDGRLFPGGGTIIVSGNNTYTGGTRHEEGILRLLNANALGTGAISIADGGTDPIIEIGDGLNIANELIVTNTGAQGRTIRIDTSGPRNGLTAEWSGNITLNHNGDSADFNINAGGTTNNSASQILTVSGQISGSPGDANFVAIDIEGGDGTVILNNTANDFVGRIRVQQNGGTLRVVNDAALSSAAIQLNNTNSRVMIENGLTVDNEIIFGTNNNDKRLQLEPGTNNQATWSGNITVLEETDDNAEFSAQATTSNTFDTDQRLNLTGTITSTTGAGIEIIDNGVVVLNNASGNNDITGNVRLSSRGSELWVMTTGSLASSGTNNIRLARQTRVQLADGVHLSANTTLEATSTNNNGKTLQVYNANDGVAESASFAGNIVVDDPDRGEFNVHVGDDFDTMTLSGVVSGVGGIHFTGDGTLIFDGSAPNINTGWTELGDGGSSTIDINGDGARNGVVIIDRSDVFGTSEINWRGAQLQIADGTPSFTIANDNELNGNLNLGGNVAVTLSGNIDVIGNNARDIGHYSLDGVTHTLSGNIFMNESSIEVRGTNGADNGTFVISGDIAGNVTATNDSFELDETFDNGDVFLSGNNSNFHGRILNLGSNATLHVSDATNLGAVGANASLLNRLWLGNGGVLHSSGNISLNSLHNVQLTGTGGGVFDTDAGTEFTINGILNGSGDLTKRGDGTLILNGVNTHTGAVNIEAGTLAANGTAILDTTTVTLSNAAGASFRIDADETVGSIAGGGTTGGNVNLQGNTLTISSPAVETYSGNIIGTGNLVKSGSSTQSLAGNTNFTGDTTINSGTLNFNTGTTHQTNVTVNDGGRLGGEGTIGNLTLAANSIVNFDGGTSGAITVGDLSSGSTVFVDPIVVGSGNVIVFTGTYTPTVDAMTDFQVLGGAARAGSVFGNTTNAITLTLATADRTWDGNVSGVVSDVWDNGTTAAWQGGDELFFTGDTVFFDDSRDAAATGNIQLGAGVNISADSITFGNATNGATSLSYTIEDSTPGDATTGFETISASGGGITVASNNSADINIQVGISGSTNIVHSGSGNLIIGDGNNTHTRTGTTIVNGGGTLVDDTFQSDGIVETPSTILGDTATGSLVLGNGATFDINGDKNFKAYGTGSIELQGGSTVANSAFGGNGGTNEDAANAFADEIKITGVDSNITFAVDARIDIDGQIDFAGSNTTITVTTGDWLLLGGDHSAATAGGNLSHFQVNNAQLIMNNNNAFGTATIAVSAGDVRVNNSRTINNDVTLTGSGGIGVANGSSTLTMAGNLHLNGNGVDIDPGNTGRRVLLTGNVDGTGTNVDILEGITRIASSANLTYTGRFDLGDNNGGDVVTFELGDGVTIGNEVRIENVDSTDAGSIVIRLESGATSGGISGDLDIRQDDDVFDIRALSGQTLTVSGDISSNEATDSRIRLVGDGNVSTADGTVIFSGTNNTYETGTNISDQVTLQIGDGGANGGLGTGDVTIDSNATLAINRNDSHTVSNVITGTGSVSHIGSGNATLAGNNTYSGTTNFNAGNLSAGHVNGLGTSTLTFGGGSLRYTAADAGTDYSNRIKNSTSAVSLDTNGQDVTLAGVIDATNSGGLTKLGTGSLALDGANTYTGNTTVSAGTLLVNGSTDAGSAVTVGTGGTLGGSGTVGGTTTIQSGGTHTGGTITTAAQQTFSGDLNYNDGATVSWNLIDNSTGAANFDNFVVGSGTIGFENGGTFNIALTFTDSVNFYDSFWQDTTNEWKIWDFAGGSLDEADFDSLTINLFIDGSSTAAGLPADASAFELRRTSDLAGTDGIWLHQISAIPEPGTYGLMALALAGFGWFARRRRITAKKDAA